MATFKIYKVTSFPGSPQPDAVYIAKINDRAVIKVTDSSGVYKNNDQTLQDVLDLGVVAVSNFQLTNPATNGVDFLVNGNEGSYGLGDLELQNNGTYILIDDAGQRTVLGNIPSGSADDVLVINPEGEVKKTALGDIAGSLAPALTNQYIGYGNASNAITGSGDMIRPSAGQVRLAPSSGAEPRLELIRGSYLTMVATSSSTWGDYSTNDGLVYTSNDLCLVSEVGDVQLLTVPVSGNPTARIIAKRNGDIIFPALGGSGNKALGVDNTGKVVTSAAPVFDSGTYSPTLTAISNSPTLLNEHVSSYTRVGNIVTVYGDVQVTSSATATETAFQVSLPIASNLSTTANLSGMAQSRTVGYLNQLTVILIQNWSADAAQITIKDIPAAVPQKIAYTFQYVVE